MIENPIGGGIKKKPRPVKSNANHLEQQVRQSARPGANTLCRALAFCCLKMIGIAKVQK